MWPLSNLGESSRRWAGNVYCVKCVKSVCWRVVVVVVQLFVSIECEWTSLRKLVSRERESLLL